jgi:hypothetical protein
MQHVRGLLEQRDQEKVSLFWNVVKQPPPHFSIYSFVLNEVAALREFAEPQF